MRAGLHVLTAFYKMNVFNLSLVGGKREKLMLSCVDCRPFHYEFHQALALYLCILTRASFISIVALCICPVAAKRASFINTVPWGTAHQRLSNIHQRGIGSFHHCTESNFAAYVSVSMFLPMLQI